MKKTKKTGKTAVRLYFFITLLLYSILLTGCGGKEEPEIYTDINVERVQLPDLTESVDVSDMIGYEYLGSQYYEGKIVQIWGERQLEGCSIYLHREDGNRELLAEHVNPFDMYPGWWIDNQKRCFYRDGNMLVRISENGEKIFTAKPEGDEQLQDICQMKDGRIVVATGRNAESRLWVLDPDSGSFSALMNPSLNTTVSLIAPNGEGLMMVDDNGLWEVSLTDGALNKILSFSGTSYSLKKDKLSTGDDYQVKEDVRLSEDGNAQLLWSNGVSEVLHPIEIEGGKKILVLRDLYADTLLREQIVAFNEKTEDYYIIIQDLTMDDLMSASTMQEFREQTDREFATGRGADIVNFNALNDVYSLLDKGAFADLTSFMESSGLAEDGYFPSTFLKWKNGEIYGFNYEANISGFWLDKAIAGDSRISGVEELVDCLLAYEGDAVISDSASNLQTFLENSESLCGMVDFENNTCDFSKDLFGKMLEAAKRYGTENAKDTSLEAAGTIDYINFFYFSDSKYLDETGKVPIGYLFDDGGHTKINVYSTLAMNENSENKEGAWEFFRYLLSEEIQNGFEVDPLYYTEYKYYPADREIFDALCKKHETFMEKGFQQVLNNTQITALTKERKEDLRAALEDAKSAPLWTQDLIQIIVEEARPYFSGQKSIEEVQSIVQNRVQLYLNEKK